MYSNIKFVFKKTLDMTFCNTDIILVSVHLTSDTDA